MKKLLFVLVAGVFLLAVGFGVFLRPLLYTLTPLQRYYLGAYLASSWHETGPAATSEIQWIWKFKRKRVVWAVLVGGCQSYVST
jgi:hypothetical protein